MEAREAIRFLHPDTTTEALNKIEYYGGFKGVGARLKAYDEACLLACEALEKQVPMKPIDKSRNPKDWHIMCCHACGRIFWNSGQFMHYQPKYCEKCGQAILWEE